MKRFLILTTSILLLAAACNKQPVTYYNTEKECQDQTQKECARMLDGPNAGKYSASDVTLQAQNQPTQQTKPADETANWKTYTNAKYGIEIKYPPYNSELDSNIIIELLDNTKPVEGPSAFWTGLSQDLWHKRFANKGTYKIGDKCPTGESEMMCQVYSLNPYALKIEEDWAAPHPHPYQLVFPTKDFELSVWILPSNVSNDVLNQIVASFKITK